MRSPCRRRRQRHRCSRRRRLRHRHARRTGDAVRRRRHRHHRQLAVGGARRCRRRLHWCAPMDQQRPPVRRRPGHRLSGQSTTASRSPAPTRFTAHLHAFAPIPGGLPSRSVSATTSVLDPYNSPRSSPTRSSRPTSTHAATGIDGLGSRSHQAPRNSAAPANARRRHLQGSGMCSDAAGHHRGVRRRSFYGLISSCSVSPEKRPSQPSRPTPLEAVFSYYRVNSVSPPRCSTPKVPSIWPRRPSVKRSTAMATVCPTTSRP